jgi:hypothetical protein
VQYSYKRDATLKREYILLPVDAKSELLLNAMKIKDEVNVDEVLRSLLVPDKDEATKGKGKVTK